MRFRPSAFAALVLLMPAMAFAQTAMTDHGHGQAMSAPRSAPGTTGTVNAVDAKAHTVNLSHGAIEALGWPAMTMDFGVGPAIDLASLKVGDRVAFTVAKTADGGYLIDSLKPAK